MDEDKVLNTLQREGLALASVQKRAVAFFIDDMIISLLFGLIFYKEFSALSGDPIAMVNFVNAIFPYVLSVKILYHTVFVYLYGATLGKMALKIRVIDIAYLDAPDFITALSRALVRVVSEMIFYLGFVWALFNQLNLTWHDRVAKTLVVDA